MKNTRLTIFSLSVALIMTACAGTNQKESKKGEGNTSIQPSAQPSTSQQTVSSNITLKDPRDTSMLTANCKAYIDDMRKQEEELDDDPYMYSDLNLYEGVHIEDTKYLDTGDVNGKNETVNGQIPDRSDKSLGIDLEFTVEDGYEADEYTVLVSQNDDMSDAKEFKTTGNKVNVQNLFVNTEYYWQVIADDEESEISSFTTGDYPRWITCRSLTGEEGGRGIYNVRDLGGYMTESGQRVKQGLVYRGGEITTMTSSGHYNTITEVAKKAFREDMGMVGGIELDLRGTSDIGDGYKACAFAEDGDIDYVMHAIKSYEETFTKTRSEVAPIFELLKEADKKPVYFHCFGGADRTGTIGFLLNGLLGVSYTDLVIDFELTSYSSINNEHIRCHMPTNTSLGQRHQHSYDRWPALINQIKTDTTGGYAWDDDALLMDNIESFLVKACSVPQTTIDTIRDIMLED